MKKEFFGLVLLGACFLFLEPAYGQTAGSPKPVSIQWGVKIPVRDGIKLNGTLYKPGDLEEPLPIRVSISPSIPTFSPLISSNG